MLFRITVLLCLLLIRFDLFIIFDLIRTIFEKKLCVQRPSERSYETKCSRKNINRSILFRKMVNCRRVRVCTSKHTRCGAPNQCTRSRRVQRKKELVLVYFVSDGMTESQNWTCKRSGINTRSFHFHCIEEKIHRKREVFSIVSAFIASAAAAVRFSKLVAIGRSIVQ